MNESLSHTPLTTPIIEKGNSRLIYDLLKKDLQKDFNNNYYSKITKSETKYEFLLAPTGDNRVSIFYNTLDGHQITRQDFEGGRTATIKLRGDNYKSGVDLINAFKQSNWHQSSECSSELGRYYWWNDFDGWYQNSPVKIHITLVPKWSHNFGKYPAPSLDSFNYQDNSTGKIKLYFDENKNDDQFIDASPEKHGIFSTDDITFEEKNKLMVW